ncbi:MAG: DNA replication protein [Magnetovibrio sp.]|nr:DNA replication protein [Magnetovibrio sp.]
MSLREQIPLQFEHESAQCAENYLVTESNKEAVEWVDRWPSWPSPVIAIYGPPGAGKTHLGVIFIEKTHARIPDLSNPTRWIEKPEGPWLIDDFEKFIDRVGEEALLHFFNSVIEAQGKMLLIGRHPPSKWNLLLPDLRSRLLAVISVEISSPDDTLLAAVLVKLLKDRQLNVNTEVIMYLLARMERSFTAAGNLVDILDNLALSERRAITIPLVKRVLNNWK